MNWFVLMARKKRISDILKIIYSERQLAFATRKIPRARHHGHCRYSKNQIEICNMLLKITRPPNKSIESELRPCLMKVGSFYSGKGCSSTKKKGFLLDYVKIDLVRFDTGGRFESAVKEFAGLGTEHLGISEVVVGLPFLSLSENLRLNCAKNSSTVEPNTRDQFKHYRSNSSGIHSR